MVKSQGEKHLNNIYIYLSYRISKYESVVSALDRESNSCVMPVHFSINPFTLNLCFHIDCPFVILMMKQFCRGIVLQVFQLIR